jgi:hypothetical protein
MTSSNSRNTLKTNKKFIKDQEKKSKIKNIKNNKIN